MGRTRREHTMKRTIVIIGVAAAMAVAPAVASAAGNSPQRVKRTPAKPAAVLQTTQDDRSGQTLYRLGDSGLWMQ
jgi:hypothetical protein